MIYFVVVLYNLAWLAAVVYLIMNNHPWWAAIVLFGCGMGIKDDEK